MKEIGNDGIKMYIIKEEMTCLSNCQKWNWQLYVEFSLQKMLFLTPWQLKKLED